MREDRSAFSESAEQLRSQGVAANATERAVRGQTRPPVRDGIYRAALRGESTHVRKRLERAGQHAPEGAAAPNSGSAVLEETLRNVIEGWHATADQLINAGQTRLAEQVWKFLANMPKPQTEQAILKNISRTRMDKERQPERDERAR